MTRRTVSARADAMGAAAAAGWLADALAPLVEPALAATTGIYLATADAGGTVSIAFWAAALDTGVDLASPGDFPWTLASAATTHVALRHGLSGPNVTLVGGDEASWGAIEAAADDLARGVVARALVVRFDERPGVTVDAVAPGARDDWFDRRAGGDPIVRACAAERALVTDGSWGSARGTGS